MATATEPVYLLRLTASQLQAVRDAILGDKVYAVTLRTTEGLHVLGVFASAQAAEIFSGDVDLEKEWAGINCKPVVEELELKHGSFPCSEAHALAQKLRLYLSPHPAGHCADCGAKIEGEAYVSPESTALTEVVLEGFKAIQAEARVICLPCYRLAFHRVSGPESVCPL